MTALIASAVDAGAIISRQVGVPACHGRKRAVGSASATVYGLTCTNTSTRLPLDAREPPNASGRSNVNPVLSCDVFCSTNSPLEPSVSQNSTLHQHLTSPISTSIHQPTSIHTDLRIQHAIAHHPNIISPTTNPTPVSLPSQRGTNSPTSSFISHG